VLTPALLGTFVILLANALGAYATVYALTTGNFNVLPIRIAGLVSGDISSTESGQRPGRGAGGADDPRHRRPSIAAEEELPCPALNPARPASTTASWFICCSRSCCCRWWVRCLLDRQQLVGDHPARGFTFKWYLQLWSDPRFLHAFGQSLLVCVGALVLSVVLILPLLFVCITTSRSSMR
jgi:ABC-type sugar transport system permease subunit